GLVVLHVEAEVVFGPPIASDSAGGVLHHLIASTGDHAGANLRDGYHGIISRGITGVVIPDNNPHRVKGTASGANGPGERAGHAASLRVGTIDQKDWRGAKSGIIIVSIYKGHRGISNIAW